MFWALQKNKKLMKIPTEVLLWRKKVKPFHK